LQDDVSGSASTVEMVQLLQIVFQTLVECLPAPETAEILITSCSKILVEYTRKVKKMRKQKAKTPVTFTC
jgi:hypothetical protein